MKVENPLYLLDTKIHPFTYDEALAAVKAEIDKKEYQSKVIIQSNVFTFVNAHEDSGYREAVNSSFLSLPDGMPIVWLLNALWKQNLPDRIYGPELMLRMCRMAERYGWSCFFYGGRESTLALLQEELLKRYPGLIIAGAISPPFRELTDEEIQRDYSIINNCKPDILWVGLGSPKQDLWMDANKSSLNVNILHGVGAAFDFISGSKKQSPKFFMDNGLEWFHRLITEPRRLWKRYLIGNTKFIIYLLLSFFSKRLKMSRTSP